MLIYDSNNAKQVNIGTCILVPPAHIMQTVDAGHLSSTTRKFLGTH